MRNAETLWRRCSICMMALLAVSMASFHPNPDIAFRSVAMHEIEPNDSLAEATWCGSLQAGVRLTISGHVGSEGADVLDRFAFTTCEASTVRFRLRPSLHGTELNLCVVDSSLRSIRAVSNGAQAAKGGALEFDRAGIDFQVVVSSDWGSSGYLLEIETVPLAATAPPGLVK